MKLKIKVTSIWKCGWDSSGSRQAPDNTAINYRESLLFSLCEIASRQYAYQCFAPRDNTFATHLHWEEPETSKTSICEQLTRMVAYFDAETSCNTNSSYRTRLCTKKCKGIKKPSHQAEEGGCNDKLINFPGAPHTSHKAMFLRRSCRFRSHVHEQKLKNDFLIPPRPLQENKITGLNASREQSVPTDPYWLINN